MDILATSPALSSKQQDKKDREKLKLAQIAASHDKCRECAKEKEAKTETSFDKNDVPRFLMNEELFADSRMQPKRLDSPGQIVHHITMNAVILTDKYLGRKAWRNCASQMVGWVINNKNLKGY